MKFNSILGVLLVLLAAGMVISTASAVNLVDDFGIDVSGADFNETVNIANNDMELVIFENSGNDSSDVNSIIYFKDSTADKKEITSFIKGLENAGTKVEENDKYAVIKNNQDFNFDVGNDLDGIFSFAESLFSSGDGLNISAGGDSISISGNGLEVSDASGENVSITSEGISVSGGESSDNVTVDANSNIENSNYSLYLKNNDGDKVIVISGNNLVLLKSMAETVSFN